MNADDLRALQAPLKTRYKDAPAAALITLTAEGNLDDQEIACSVETVKSRLHRARAQMKSLPFDIVPREFSVAEAPRSQPVQSAEQQTVAC